MTYPRLILAFGLVAIVGALLASGRLAGEGGWQTAFGITILVAGAVGVTNVIFFRRLKASLDELARSRTGGERTEDLNR